MKGREYLSKVKCVQCGYELEYTLCCIIQYELMIFVKCPICGWVIDFQLPAKQKGEDIERSQESLVPWEYYDENLNKVGDNDL